MHRDWIAARSFTTGSDTESLETKNPGSAGVSRMPGTLQRRTLFALTGVPAIYVLNVLRCGAIAWLHLNHPQMVDFAHHYLFAVVVYGFIFFMLVQYSKKIRQEKKMESIK